MFFIKVKIQLGLRPPSPLTLLLDITLEREIMRRKHIWVKAICHGFLGRNIEEYWAPTASALNCLPPYFVWKRNITLFFEMPLLSLWTHVYNPNSKELMAICQFFLLDVLKRGQKSTFKKVIQLGCIWYFSSHNTYWIWFPGTGRRGTVAFLLGGKLRRNSLNCFIIIKTMTIQSEVSLSIYSHVMI